jgi:hypothetical protein
MILRSLDASIRDEELKEKWRFIRYNPDPVDWIHQLLAACRSRSLQAGVPSNSQADACSVWTELIPVWLKLWIEVTSWLAKVRYLSWVKQYESIDRVTPRRSETVTLIFRRSRRSCCAIRSEMKDAFDHESRNARTDLKQPEVEIKLIMAIASSTIARKLS